MPPPLNATSLVQRVLRVNAKLRAYGDRGFVRELYEERRVVVTFTTSFRRPGWFRFDFQSPHPYRPLRTSVSRTIVGNDKEGPYFWSSRYGSPPTIENEESLLMAVAGATGISRGSAHTIATLLLPETGPGTLHRLRRVRALPSSTVRGTYCLGMVGRHPAGGQVQIHVGAHDFMVRKVVHRYLKHVEVRHPKPLHRVPRRAERPPQSEA
jgi:hypothetical protein